VVTTRPAAVFLEITAAAVKICKVKRGSVTPARLFILGVRTASRPLLRPIATSVVRINHNLLFWMMQQCKVATGLRDPQGVGMVRKFQNILETVGNTPVVKINKLAPPEVNLYVKIEAFNPLGSVKDRLALGVIEAAERSGELKLGQTVIEATSGNTGIGLAMVCAQKGYPLVITMAETFSVERRKLMRFLGAKVVLTPAALRGMGMVIKAIELAKTHGWFLTRQFENEANPDMHSRTTAREIIADFAGEPLDYWVTGYGTGGTLKGVARVLAKERPQTKIVVCEPQDAPLLGSGIAQQRNPDGSPAAAHPAFKSHPMQGWTPDFIPKLTADAVDLHVIDRIIPIPNADALQYSRELAQKEGIFVGITAGATFAGALRVCAEAPKGATVLCMLPDTGERYLSTPLFGDIPADMTDEEITISRSTPTAQMGT
jgi:cysteine synthase A